MKEWSYKKLGNLFDVQVGGDLQKDKFFEKWSEYFKYPIFSNSLTEKGLYGYTSNYRFPANCVTVTGRGALGHAEYRNTPFDAIVRLLVLIPKIEVDCRYINHVINFAIESTGVPQLPAPRIKKIRVFLPDDINEQKAIAEVLVKVDDVIESVEKSLVSAENLRKSLMQNMLTGKLKPDGTWRSEDEFYEDEKFGKVPKGWEIKKIKDIFCINEETLPSKTELEFRLRYITIDAVKTECVDYESCPEYLFKDAPGRARRRINNGDILISGVRPNLKAFVIYEAPNKENWICSTVFCSFSKGKRRQ